MEPRLQISGDHDHKLESQFLHGFRIVEILKNTDQASCKTPVTKGKKTFEARVTSSRISKSYTLVCIVISNLRLLRWYHA